MGLWSKVQGSERMEQGSGVSGNIAPNRDTKEVGFGEGALARICFAKGMTERGSSGHVRRCSMSSQKRRDVLYMCLVWCEEVGVGLGGGGGAWGKELLFRVQGVGCRVWGAGFQVQGSGSGQGEGIGV